MKRVAFRVWTYALAVSLAACSGGTSSITALPHDAARPASGSGSSPIQHIVIIVQENRTFNDLFATFPGANGTTVGERRIGKGKKAKTEPINLKEANLYDKTSLNHLHSSFVTAYDGGKMDGFNQIQFEATKKNEGTQPYQYVNPSQIEPYWTMASTYGLAEEMFQTQGSGSFTAHQDLIRGGTGIDASASLIDDPSSTQAWGCDAPAGTVTSLITTSLQVEKDQGPFPCTSSFPSSGSYETLRDLLDAKSVSWKYYVPQFAKGLAGALWNAFDVIAPVRYGSEWGTNVSWPQTNVLTDISSGNLPAVSWVIPDEDDSDHPGYGGDTGPSWVSSVVNAVGASSYWNSTAIVILWDDWGGFYDPQVPPPLDDQGGPGFRVPMIVVSPYAKPAYISQTVYGFGSVIQFVEDTFNLGSLGTTDETCNSMDDMFNFQQSPLRFKVIPAKYSRAFFLHQKPSGLPVDTQ